MTDDSYDEESNPEILKADVLGRVSTPPAKREAILDAFEKSGLSGAAFARAHGIKYCTFATWRQKRKKQRGEYSAATDQTDSGRSDSSFTFLEVIPGSNGGIEPRDQDVSSLNIDFGAGIKMEISSDSQVVRAARLIRLIKA